MPQIKVKHKITLIILGLFLFIILLEAGLRLGGWAVLSLQEYRNRASLRRKGTYRILCIGESTTMDQWPRPLEQILNQRDIGLKFSVIDKGVAGSKSTDLLRELEDNLNKYDPDMVIAMMGVNEEAGSFLYDEATYNDSPRIILFIKSLRIYKLGHLLLSCISRQGYKDNFWVRQKTHQKFLVLRQEISGDPNHSQNEDSKDSDEYSAGGAPIGVAQSGSDDYDYYIALGVKYISEKEFQLAEETFKKAEEISPSKGSAYEALAELYMEQGRREEAKEIYRREFDMAPSQKDNAYLGLGLIYLNEGNFDEVKKIFMEAIELGPIAQPVYMRLSHFCILRGRYTELEKLLKEVLKEHPDNVDLYSLLGQVYRAQDKDKLAEEYFKEAYRLRLKRYNPQVLHNHNRLKDILAQKRIRLVCAQYPLRSITLLERIFDSTGDVVFVDNEEVFKNALRESSYDEYFSDMFAGDFGHCTPKGNRLLAENIADTILKEVFGK